MKQLLVIFSLLVLLPISGFAISLNELQGNPSQYVKVVELPNTTTYVDINSIKSLRYAPPYYTMQTRVHTVSYNELSIITSDLTFNYDYNRSIVTLHPLIPKNNPNSSNEEKERLLQEELFKDCGVSTKISRCLIYTWEGTYITQLTLGDLADLNSRKTQFISENYNVANFIFKKYYNQYFSLPIPNSALQEAYK